MKKKILWTSICLALVIIIVLLIIFSFPASEKKTHFRTIKDMTGNKVQIPYNINRIVTAMYPIATQLVFLTESQDKLAGISDFDINDAMIKIYPQIEKIYRPLRHGNGDVTVEEIIKINPDVLFLSKRNPQNINFVKLGIPSVFLTLENPEQLMQGIELVGSIMHKQERAQKVICYFRERLEYIRNKTSTIKNKKKVYYAGPDMLSTAGGDFYQNFIIEYAGGINVAREHRGGWSNISLEQLIFWNPDLIFIGNYGTAKIKDFTNDKRLGSLSAIQSKEVYKSPHYIGGWDVPNPESILGIMWLANKLYPKEVCFDMQEEIKMFYTVCYGYRPDNKDMVKILETQELR